MKKDLTLREVETLANEFELNKDSFESISDDELLSIKNEIKESAKQRQIRAWLKTGIHMRLNLNKFLRAV